MPSDLGPLRLRVAGYVVDADGRDVGSAPIDLGVIEIPIRVDTSPKTHPVMRDAELDAYVAKVARERHSTEARGAQILDLTENRPTPATIRHPRRATFPAER